MRLRALLAASLAVLGLACGRSSGPAPSAERAGEGPSAPAPSAVTGSPEVGSPERGREIFLRGVSPSGGEITAEVGMRGGAVVPAASLPCVNCHGRDGRGRPEGGVTPSNIRWESLTRPYEVQEAGGRVHPPYDDRLAGRAITMGVDPAGQRLDDAMPRYRLGRRDLADLLAYLKALSAERDPGLSDTEIRIGTLIPADGPLAESGAAARALLAAYFEDLDERGGVYGRRIELVFAAISASGEGAERAREVERFLDRARPFALTAVLLGGDDQPIATLLEAQQIPVIGAVTLHARAAAPPARAVFHLYAGLAEQALTLAIFASRLAPSAGAAPRLAVLHQASRDQAEIARRIAEKLDSLGAPKVVELELDETAKGAEAALSGLAPGAAGDRTADAAREKVGAALLLGPAAAQTALFRDPSRSRTLILLPGALAGEELFGAEPALAERVRVAFPVLPSDRTLEGMAEYRRLAARHHLSEEHLSAQLSALAAAKVLVEGLTRAGRDASRERLIEAVESLRDFPTGLTPPLTFGKNRRIGAAGAHIVTLDPRARRFVPIGPWISAE